MFWLYLRGRAANDAIIVVCLYLRGSLLVPSVRGVTSTLAGLRLVEVAEEVQVVEGLWRGQRDWVYMLVWK